MTTHVYLAGQGVWRDLSGMFAVSLVLHVFVVAASVVFHIPSRKIYVPPVYTVDLVSLPEASSLPEVSSITTHDTPNLEKGATQLIVNKMENKSKKEFIVKPKEVPKERILPKEPAVIEKVEVKEPVDTPKTDRPRTEEIGDEISAEERIASAVAAIRARFDEKQGSGSGIISGPSAGTTSDDLALKLRIYYTRIWDRIRNNWIFPGRTIKWKDNLQAIVVIQIAQDGKIIGCRFERRSGNDLFDQSVVKAIRRSDPLPGLPEGYMKATHELGIRFNLSELSAG